MRMSVVTATTQYLLTEFGAPENIEDGVKVGGPLMNAVN